MKHSGGIQFNERSETGTEVVSLGHSLYILVTIEKGTIILGETNFADIVVWRHILDSQLIVDLMCKKFFISNIEYYNRCYILQYFNYYATLQGRYHEEQKTMSTTWPTHKNIQLYQQLNKHLQMVHI